MKQCVITLVFMTWVQSNVARIGQFRAENWFQFQSMQPWFKVDFISFTSNRRLNSKESIVPNKGQKEQLFGVSFCADKTNQANTLDILGRPWPSLSDRINRVSYFLDLGIIYQKIFKPNMNYLVGLTWM